jgi:hypothetical protein
MAAVSAMARTNGDDFKGSSMGLFSALRNETADALEESIMRSTAQTQLVKLGMRATQRVKLLSCANCLE